MQCLHSLQRLCFTGHRTERSLTFATSCPQFFSFTGDTKFRYEPGLLEFCDCSQYLPDQLLGRVGIADGQIGSAFTGNDLHAQSLKFLHYEFLDNEIPG